MRFTLDIDMSNAAFDLDGFDDPLPELTRILKLVASQVERGSRSAPVLDVNGNTVGSWAVRP